jgi:hypothetical protein
MPDDLTLEAELIKYSFQQMYLQKGKDKEPHRELHAANLLESNSEWCTRRYVLMNLFPDEVQKPELHSWDWKREIIFDNGWSLHERWQNLFSRYGNVVRSRLLNGQVDPLAPESLELDLTHYLEEENLYFSPDAIIEFGGTKYLIEIKGIKQEDFVNLTGDLMQAIMVSQVVAKARIQANNYLYFTGLQKAILLIENKNTQDFRVYVMERDYALYETYEWRIGEVKHNTRTVKMYDMKSLSPRICASSQDRLAKNCPLRDVCFSERVEVKES